MIVRTYRRRAIIDAVIMMLCIVFVLMLMTQTARADGEPDASLMIDPARNEENYTAVLYDNTNGLPTSEANAIAEPKELLTNVHRTIDAFVGDSDRFDDLTMLCLEYNGPDEEINNNISNE
ncbi:MAG: hypothetical protein IKE85_00245 [Mogibacterium sp.]|nr:hypothetical protein [Mogibacterium sp.]